MPASLRRNQRPRAVPAREPAVTVRAATPADLDVVLGMRLALLREEARSPVFARPRRDAAQLARDLSAQQLASPAEVTLLAFAEDRPVGLLRATVSRGARLVSPSRYGFLTSAYVVPAYRRRGVLRALLRVAEGWCRARGLREVRLHCTVENEAGQATWARLGYQEAEIVRRLVLTRD
jgi:ribosomal protein S18 acetylase RimI-like enzyme